MSYALSARATLDLESMVETSAGMFGLSQASKYSEGLLRTFDFLGEFPKLRGSGAKSIHLYAPAHIKRMSSSMT